MTTNNRAVLSGLAPVMMTLALAMIGCGGEEPEPMGNPIAENCGFVNSTGNDIGIGKYCTKSSECPAVSGGAALQCSTVLVDPTFPLLCSRLCDPQAIDPGCGSDAVCKSLLELGINLTACVPRTCQPLFADPL